MANISTIELMNSKIIDRLGVSFLVDKTEFFIPLEEKIDLNEELNKIEAELQYYNGFIENVLKKLSNEKFVSCAPKNVVDMELKKKQDAEDKIRKLSELKKSLIR
jgi:valyl-tRNA synthetase